MVRYSWVLAVFLISVLLSGRVAAFRTCEAENSHAYAASTQYTVAEIVFDEVTGLSSGTRTIFNYANQDGVGFTECHVTYELSGSYTPVAETFVFEGRRTNYSPACPLTLLEAEYPAYLRYSLQMNFAADGTSQVNIADNDEFLANGSWESGHTVYKTDENCSIF